MPYALKQACFPSDTIHYKYIDIEIIHYATEYYTVCSYQHFIAKRERKKEEIEKKI